MVDGGESLTMITGNSRVAAAASIWPLGALAIQTVPRATRAMMGVMAVPDNNTVVVPRGSAPSRGPVLRTERMKRGAGDSDKTGISRQLPP